MRTGTISAKKVAANPTMAGIVVKNAGPVGSLRQGPGRGQPPDIFVGQLQQLAEDVLLVLAEEWRGLARRIGRG